MLPLDHSDLQYFMTDCEEICYAFWWKVDIHRARWLPSDNPNTVNQASKLTNRYAQVHRLRWTQVRWGERANVLHVSLSLHHPSSYAYRLTNHLDPSQRAVTTDTLQYWPSYVQIHFITCSTVVLQCYRRRAIPMEQGKIRHSVTLYSLDWSLPNLIWLITSGAPTHMPILVEFGWVGKPRQ